MRLGLLVALAALVFAPDSSLWAQRTDNPHGPEIGSCSTCHASNGWRPVQISKQFKHAVSTFPLEGAHVRTSCTGCHKSLEFSKVTNTCASCHNDVHQKELGTDCARCHTTRSFVDQGQLKRMHELTRMPLRGAHAAARCDACHTPAMSGRPQYTGRSTACIGCHLSDYRLAKSPDHAASHFPQDCASCHGSASWQDATFDHSATRFALEGAHKAVSCSSCHADKVFRGKTMECVGCHQGDYDKSVNPPHSPGFPTACASCHTVASWKDAKFDHNTTLFALTGAHKTVSCASCHSDKVYKGKSTACISCHQRSFDTAIPPHTGFSSTCADCHTSMTTWQGAAFDHSRNAFPLTGAHLAVSCTACHGDKVYKGKPTTCSSCHQARYTSTANPPHGAAGFSTSCESCHTTKAWTPAPYDHSVTRFPLEGAHTTTSCMSCHGDGVYRGKSTTCVSCHQRNYDTAIPSHAGYSTSCRDCHTSMTTWKSAAFDHQSFPFPLTGAHLTVSCAGCHSDGVYKGKATTCVSCHQARYNATTNPAHGPAGFSTTCESCHTTTSWASSFNHSNTSFPLEGTHAVTPCMSCHGDGVYDGKPTTCISCHQPDYNTAQPPHTPSSFSSACRDCHTSMTTWAGASYNHSLTSFPLTGAHLAVACSGCHADKVYDGKPTTCVSCHLSRYNTTTNPAHGAAGFSTACETCHTTSVWVPSTFDHSTTRFPLTGAHKTVTCNGCHGDGVYRGKTMVCSGCHMPDYTATTNPNHAAAAFPTTCESCHTTTSWLGATFDHDSKFPIYSGAHKDRWRSCSDCHTSPTNYAVFSCFQCHLKSDMDSKHKSISGYSYDSAKCYACHPRGNH